MHIAIIGAGAIGCTVAAQLHLAGQQVTLVGRGSAWRSIAEHGIRLTTDQQTTVVPVSIATQVPTNADLLIIAVKSHQTAHALQRCPRIPTILFQAGVSSEPFIGSDRLMIGAMIGFAAQSVEPGAVSYTGPLMIELGDWPNGVGELTQVFGDLLTESGFDVRCRDDIMLWRAAQLIHELSQALHLVCGAIPDDLVDRMLIAAEQVMRTHLGRPLLSHKVFADRLGFEASAYGRTYRIHGPLWQSCVRQRPTEFFALTAPFSESSEQQLFRRLGNIVSSLEVPGSFSTDDLHRFIDEGHQYDIRVLKGLEAVRRRPGMYFGDTEKDAAKQMLWELLGNVVDLHMRGCCQHVAVSLEAGGFTVSDDGPGIDNGVIHEVLSALHAGATYDGHWPHFHLRNDLAGIGLAAVNGASSLFTATNRRDGRAIERTYACGELIDGPIDLGPCETTGLTIRLEIDREIISAPLCREQITERLERIVALTNLHISLDGDSVGGGGFEGYLQRHHGAPTQPPQIKRRGCVNDIDVEMVIWSQTHEQTCGVSFVNFVQTKEGGTHEQGLSLEPKGMFFGVHAVLANPRFGGPTKEHLKSEEVRAAVASVLDRVLQ